jgi:endonuclease YncB( thermonuclease family)
VRSKPGCSLVLAAVGLALAATGCGGEGAGSGTLEAAQPAAAAGRATVAAVGDGDTLRLTNGRKVRLLQIDAPELHGDCYGKAALAALRRLTPPGSTVILVRDPELDATDRYGRLLRYVFAGGTNVSLALVRQGAASPYFYRGERGRYAADLLAAVAGARAARRGYWGACPRAELNTGVGSVTGPA